MKDIYVLIPASEYVALLDTNEELSGLVGAGVDNWSGYGEVDWESVEAEQGSNYKKVAGMKGYTSMGEEIN